MDVEAVTTPVADERAVVLPARFVAVTATRNVRPTSLAATVYVLDLAPAIPTQLPPELSQARQAYA